jgi:hypothetical protein
LVYNRFDVDLWGKDDEINQLMSDKLPKISAAMLRKAAELRDKIEELERQYDALLAGSEEAPVRRGRKPGPKPGSKPGRKKPGPKPGRKKPGPKPGSKKKRPHSDETRKKIAAKAKARWAAKRAANA